MKRRNRKGQFCPTSMLYKAWTKVRPSRWDKDHAHVFICIGAIAWMITYASFIELVEGNTIYYQAPVVAEPKEVQIEVEIVWSEEQIMKKIRDTFTETPNTAIAVAKAESLLNARAYNPEAHRDKYGNVICYGSYGVMQIACVHMPHNPEALFDVETNLRVARKIYNERQWFPWGGYTSGSWKKYLQ